MRHSRPLLFVAPFLLSLGCSSSSRMVKDAAPVPPGEPAATLGTGTWQKLSGAPTVAGKQDDVFFLDANTGWSVNGLGRIFHTSDGGATWVKQLDQPGTYFRAIAFVDPIHGFASNIGTGYYPGVTDAQPLYVTSDGGGSWKPAAGIKGPTPKGICNFDVIDSHNVVASGRVGGPSFFLRSTDGGATWTSADLTSQIAMLIDAHFFSPTEGLITGGTSADASSQCVILRTADGGQSWKTSFTSTAVDEACWKLSFPSASVGYASVLTFGGEPSSFLKTTDGGKSWQELPFINDSYAALGIGFASESLGWIGGEAKGKPAYRTTDGGQTWQADPALGAYINRFRFLDGPVGYAIGQSVYKIVP